MHEKTPEILITGATGLLGAHLLYRLTGQGKAVRALYRDGVGQERARKIFNYYPLAAEAWQRVEWCRADLDDLPRLDELMPGIRQVYHCAALVSFAGKDRQEVVSGNRRITAHVVNAALAAGVEKLVHVSSVAALGRAADGAYRDENTRWREGKHNSAYARGKYLAELEAWRAREEGLPTVIVNPCIILGPGDWQRGSAGIFGKVARGFRFYSEGINAYVDVRDVAVAMQQLMESEIAGERFVLMSENLSYRQVFTSIARALGVPPPSWRARPWMGAVLWRWAALKSFFTGATPLVTPATVRTAFQKSYYRNDKIRQALDFNFRPVEESIQDFAAMFLKDK